MRSAFAHAETWLRHVAVIINCRGRIGARVEQHNRNRLDEVWVSAAVRLACFAAWTDQKRTPAVAAGVLSLLVPIRLCNTKPVQPRYSRGHNVGLHTARFGCRQARPLAGLSSIPELCR